MAFSEYLIEALAIAFAVSALLQLSGLRFVRALYERWEYPRNYHLFAGSVMLVTASFLVVPQTRVSGIVLAAAILFFVSVVLLSRRHYITAVPAVALLAALPAALATSV
jgi:hypothetical protein